MNKEKLELYRELIKLLLDFPDSETTDEILKQYCFLIDEDLVLALKTEADKLAKDAKEEAAQRLYDLAKQLGKAIDSWNQLNQKAFEFYEQNEFIEAIKILLQALDLAKNIWQGDHPNVAIGLNNLSELLRRQGKYEEAETFYREALVMRQRLFPGDHPDVANSLHNLSGLLGDRGKYSEAEPFCREALVMRHRLFPDDHPDVANSLHNLGGLLRDRGKYSEAEPFCREALAMNQRLFTGDHPAVAASLHNLGGLLRDRGKYNEAEPIFREALAMRHRLFPDDHPDVSSSLNNLGGLLGEQGKYDEAETFYREALVMRQRLFPGDHPDVSSSLNNLGVLFEQQGRCDEAEPFCREALAMRHRLFPDDHPAVAASLHNLGGLLRDRGKYNEAEPIFREALAMLQKLFPDDHPNVAITLHNLGGLLRDRGKYSEAEPFYSNALAMYKRMFLGDHPNVATSLNNLGGLLAQQGRYDEALDNLKEAVQLENQITRRLFSFSSEIDRIHHLDQIRNTQDILLSLVTTYLIHNAETKKTICELILQRKSLSAAAVAAFNASIYQERYVHLRKKIEQLRSLSEQIRHLETNFTLETRKSLIRLKQDYNLSEKYLTAQVPEIQLQDREINCARVAERLSEGSILIEFVRFSKYNFKDIQWSSSYYVAFVLFAKHPDKVTMKALGEAKEIEELISRTQKQAISDHSSDDSQLIRVGSKTLDIGGWKKPNSEKLKLPEYSYLPTAAIQLRQAIFDPIREYLEDSQHLFIVPDGKLSLVPFQLLPLDEQGQELLMDRYRISYLSAARDLFRSDIKTERPASSPLVIADPKFYLDSSTASNAHSETTANMSLQRMELLNLLKEGERSGILTRAETTGVLGKKIATMLGVKAYLQDEALVTHLKTNHSPNVLLIGTHGLYLPQEQEHPSEPIESLFFDSLNRFRAIGKADNPMLRSALAFAGGGTWLEGGDLPSEYGTGILFAQEVAELDLWANEITVLLACNSAVGDVSIGEGVFGLRRAFVVAGAKTLIMSLWSVPEKTSALLMERFFHNLQQNKLVRDEL